MLATGWFLLGLWAIYDIAEVSVRQAVTPNDYRGRVNAVRHVEFFGVMPFGAIAGGLLGSAIGVRPAMVVGLVGLLAAPLWLVFGGIRRLVALPAEPSSSVSDPDAVDEPAPATPGRPPPGSSRPAQR
jgi:hypothetical protein